MTDPIAELYIVGLAYMLPVLVMMLGALVLGTLIGHLYGPVPADTSAPLRTEVEALRTKLSEAGDKLAVAGTVMAQRMALREEEVDDERRAWGKQMAVLNAQLDSLKIALVAAKRSIEAPKDADRMVADPGHLARMAELEMSAARVPALLKEVNDLRQLATGEHTVPHIAPTIHARAEHSVPGKRVVQNDLKLVDGIGPKIAEHLGKHGLRTWNDVASAKPNALKKVLDEGGDRFHLHDPSSWPEQCRLMMENRWEELRKYQRKVAKARS